MKTDYYDCSLSKQALNYLFSHFMHKIASGTIFNLAIGIGRLHFWQNPYRFFTIFSKAIFIVIKRFPKSLI